LGGRRTPKARQAKSHLILELYAQVEPKKKAAIQATVARLRRQAKDDLIARIMRIEEELTEQMNVANRLREKIILADAAQHRNKLPSNEGDMMQVEQMEREFTYNGVRLPDPGHKLSVDQVRDTYAAAYPEIATASLEGPEAVGNKLVYRFSRAIGSKG
jgi:PRTRC genetic system protein C